jgi:pyrimidine operon attenuation protein/uracil phosphoribosyltransferase
MPLREKAEIVDADGLRRIVTRIAHEIVERNKGVDELVLVGIRRRGVPLATRIAEKIRIPGPRAGRGCHITLYRDDLSTVAESPGRGHDRISGHQRQGRGADRRRCSPGPHRAGGHGRAHHFRSSAHHPARRGHRPRPSRKLPIRADFVGKNVPRRRK